MRKVRVLLCVHVYVPATSGQYRAVKTHRMPLVAGLFPQKSHQFQGFFAENDL